MTNITYPTLPAPAPAGEDWLTAIDLTLTAPGNRLRINPFSGHVIQYNFGVRKWNYRAVTGVFGLAHRDIVDALESFYMRASGAGNTALMPTHKDSIPVAGAQPASGHVYQFGAPAGGRTLYGLYGGFSADGSNNQPHTSVENYGTGADPTLTQVNLNYRVSGLSDRHNKTFIIYNVILSDDNYFGIDTNPSENRFARYIGIQANGNYRIYDHNDTGITAQSGDDVILNFYQDTGGADNSFLYDIRVIRQGHSRVLPAPNVSGISATGLGILRDEVEFNPSTVVWGSHRKSDNSPATSGRSALGCVLLDHGTSSNFQLQTGARLYDVGQFIGNVTPILNNLGINPVTEITESGDLNFYYSSNTAVPSDAAGKYFRRDGKLHRVVHATNEPMYASIVAPADRTDYRRLAVEIEPKARIVDNPTYTTGDFISVILDPAFNISNNGDILAGISFSGVEE